MAVTRTPVVASAGRTSWFAHSGTRSGDEPTRQSLFSYVLPPLMDGTVDSTVDFVTKELIQADCAAATDGGSATKP